MKKRFWKKITHSLVAIFVALLMVGCVGNTEQVSQEREVLEITPVSQSLEYGAQLQYSELIAVESGNSENLEISIQSTELSGVLLDDERQTIVFESVGDYAIEIEAADEAGNTSSCTVKVEVTDKTSPIIKSEKDSFSLAEKDSQGEYISEITAYDEIDGDLTNLIEIDDSGVQYGVVGTYHLVAKVVDASGNRCEQSYEVIVKDTTAPTLSFAKTSFSITEGDNVPNYRGNVTATDGVDGDITSSIVIDDSEVDYDSKGIYKVIYKITDASGNSTTETVTVKVKEKVVSTNSSSASSSNSNSSSSEKEVMITKTGECYHTHKCGNGNYFWVSFAEAQSRGLRPCKKCY